MKQPANCLYFVDMRETQNVTEETLIIALCKILRELKISNRLKKPQIII